MGKFRTVARQMYHPATGKTTQIQMKVPVCSGVTAHGKNEGKPCRSPAIMEVGGKGYCGFHNPDKSKRRISGFKIAAAKRKMRETPIVRITRRKFNISSVESNADSFVTSLKAIMRDMVTEVIREKLTS